MEMRPAYARQMDTGQYPLSARVSVAIHKNQFVVYVHVVFSQADTENFVIVQRQLVLMILRDW